MVKHNTNFDVVIIGGGAAGFFTAINLATQRPDYKIVILERGKEVLSKVRISGGGRCNVTHAEFVPDELVKNYPRGEKELKGPFHTFCTGDTIDFFEKRGVNLKIEEDGRMFPVTDSSETIINCFLEEASKLGIKIFKGCAVKDFKFKEGQWQIDSTHTKLSCDKLILCTGSNPKIWNLLSNLGHKIIPPVPSLFTFNCQDHRIKGLAGVSTNATIKVEIKDKAKQNSPQILETEGPLLITHWGMSGPAVLKLSAWGARALAASNYEFSVKVNWLYDIGYEECISLLEKLRRNDSKKMIQTSKPFQLPKRLWVSLVQFCHINSEKRWADLSNKNLQNLAVELTQGVFEIRGKSTFKEEFVTAGGVALNEIDFRTYSSKKVSNLYFAGEVLNIDAVTGGFNFQNAWTGAFIVAKSIAEAG
ncbi:aminoacetone oxidase family FAD-binding enzyme [Ascidiimonas sp. W6]|uniref:NAD(P)/FAD-dependent oxidoreductase n=1 Tax=Ascidiimonas meishanensis TaxID=3128903 RepID=UPI0030EC6E7A